MKLIYTCSALLFCLACLAAAAPGTSRPPKAAAAAPAVHAALVMPGAPDDGPGSGGGYGK